MTRGGLTSKMFLHCISKAEPKETRCRMKSKMNLSWAVILYWSLLCINFFLVWKSNEWRVWLQDMNNFAVTTRLIINIHTAKFWRVWDEVFSHRMHTHSHRHFALAFASTYPDANAGWNKCKQKQRKRAGAPQEEERMSFSFTASTAALGRDGSIHCWLDGWECDGFSTDPGWAGSGSLSCRENGASPAPGSSGPSSRSLQAWSNSRLHETQRCHQPLHNHGQGLARQQIPLLSISARTNTRTLTSRQHTGGRAAQVHPPLPSRSQSPAHLRRRWGGHWSRAETGLSNHPVRPAPTPWPPLLLCVTDYSRKVKWQSWD